jgi:hypothetical protein
MTKNILTEIYRVKEIMGLLLESSPITTVVKNLPPAIKSVAFKTTDDVVKVIKKIISGDSNLEKKVASELKQGLETFSDETIEAISRKMIHMDDLFDLFKVSKVLPGAYDEILDEIRQMAAANVPVNKNTIDGLILKFEKSLDEIDYLPETYKEGLVNFYKTEIKKITKNLDNRIAKAAKDLPTIWPETENEVIELLKKMNVSTADKGILNRFLMLWKDKRSMYAKVLQEPKMRDYFDNPQTAMNELRILLKGSKNVEQLAKGNAIEVEVYNLIKTKGFQNAWKSMNIKQQLATALMLLNWKSLTGLLLAVLGLLTISVNFGTKGINDFATSLGNLFKVSDTSTNEFLDKSKIKETLSQPPYNYPSDIIDRLKIQISDDNKGALVEDPESDLFHEFRIKENDEGDFSIEEIK